MAEDAEIPPEYEGGRTKRQRQESPQKKKECNRRIHELASPFKRIFLALFTEHADKFPREKVENLKALLQQLYAMSPEESRRYFEQRQAEAAALAKRLQVKHAARLFLKAQRKRRQKACGLRICKGIIKKAITYAVSTPVPPLVSERLRLLSDVLLKYIVDICNAEFPDRCDADNAGNLYISVADWLAVFAERLYFMTRMTIDETTKQFGEANDTTVMNYRKEHAFIDLKRFEKSMDSRFLNSEMVDLPKKMLVKPSRKSLLDKYKVIIGRPAATSTPRQSLVETPQAASTPRQSINQPKRKQVES